MLIIIVLEIGNLNINKKVRPIYLEKAVIVIILPKKGIIKCKYLEIKTQYYK